MLQGRFGAMMAALHFDDKTIRDEGKARDKFAEICDVYIVFSNMLLHH